MSLSAVSCNFFLRGEGYHLALESKIDMALVNLRGDMILVSFWFQF